MILQSVFSLLFLAAMFALAFKFPVKEMGLLANGCALLLVGGGTMAALLAVYPLERLVKMGRLLLDAFRGQQERESTLRTLVGLGRLARRSDIRGLEHEIAGLPPGMLRIGLELIAYKYSREAVSRILCQEAANVRAGYESLQKLLRTAIRLAATLGLAGTVVSLLGIFEEPAPPQRAIGSLVVSLLFLLYGVVLANVCFAPLANKIHDFLKEEQRRMEMIHAGILAIYDHEHPLAIQYKLETIAGMGSNRRADSRRPPLVVVPYEKARGLNA